MTYIHSHFEKPRNSEHDVHHWEYGCPVRHRNYRNMFACEAGKQPLPQEE